MLRLAAALAVKDLLYDRKLFFCLSMALAAVLAPLEVLAGLKEGAVETLRRRLVENPHIREIINLRSDDFGEDFLKEFRNRADVAFLILRTRSLAASINLKRPDADRVVAADLIPTAAGDPLLAGEKPLEHREDIVLSRSAAEKLGAVAGDAVVGTVSRIIGDARETERLTLNVIGVSDSFPRDGAFVDLRLLIALEDYRDGLAVPAYGWTGKPSEQRHFAGFRMYARHIEDVKALVADLRARNIDVRDHAEEIEFVSLVDRNLNMMLGVIAAIGSAGCLVSLAVSLWANVERKRRSFSMLRLLGLSVAGMVAIPVIEAALVAALGIGIADGLFLGISSGINRFYSSGMLGNDPICHLGALQALTIAAATLVAAVISAAIAGWGGGRVEPAEALRDG